MVRFPKIRRDQRGQTAVEFMFVVVVFMFFIFFVFSFAMVLVLSSYMDYVAFMSSRAFQSATGFSSPNNGSPLPPTQSFNIANAAASVTTNGTQQEHAVQVFSDYVLPLTPTLIKDATLTLIENQQDPRQSGVRIDYKVNLFYLPPVFMGGNAIDPLFNLTVESYLGREPTRFECQTFFQGYVSKFGSQWQTDLNALVGKLDDNGC